MSALTVNKPQAQLEAEHRHPDAPFWNRMAARYARSAVKDQAAYEEKLALTRNYLTPSSRVVEFGCGTGTTALHHAPYVAHILATDVSEQMINIAREKAKAANIDNVDFAVASAESMDGLRDSADMVMAHSILHLVGDRDATIAQAFRWLKPGGVFVSSTPCLRDMVPWLKPVAFFARLVGLFPPTLRFFTQEELVASLSAAGFTIEHKFQPGPKAAVFFVARKPV